MSCSHIYRPTPNWRRHRLRGTHTFMIGRRTIRGVIAATVLLVFPGAASGQATARLDRVHSIYLGDLGPHLQSDLIRERIRARLLRSARFRVVEVADSADAVLTGVATSAAAVVRVVSKGSTETLWIFEYQRGASIARASPRVADQVAIRLLRDARAIDVPPSPAPLHLLLAAGATGGTAGYPVGPVGMLSLKWEPSEESDLGVRIDGFRASFNLETGREVDAGALVGVEWLSQSSYAPAVPFWNLSLGFFGGSSPGIESPSLAALGVGGGILLSRRLMLEARFVVVGNGNKFVPLVVGVRF